MSHPAPFGRTITAMATPFAPDGALDLGGAQELAAYLVAHGSDALVVAGSTGEASTLTDDERLALFRAVREAVATPVLAGSTSNDTAHSVELTRLAARCGVDGILAVAPYYNRPPQEGIAGHFRAIAAASELPMLVYDIPIRTGRKVANETLLRLAESCPTIVGVKDASGDPASTAHLLAAAPDGFSCYVGDDALLLPLLAVGAGGVISVSSHWIGPELAACIEAFLAGRHDEALALFRGVLPSLDFQTSEKAPNPIPTKAVLRSLGLPAGECRLPLGDAPEGLLGEASAMLAELETWRAKRGALG